MRREGHFVFGAHRADLASRALYNGGREVALPTRAFDILVVLLDSRERVVSRQELMDEVWADVVVDDSSLTQNISVLRKALGDRTSEEPVIVTVPGVGYRFDGETEFLAVPPIKTRGVARRTSRRSLVGVASILIALMVGTFAATAGRSAPRGAAGSIAVLPLRAGDFATDAGPAELALTDALIGSLAADKRLTVSPSSSVMEFSEPHRDTPTEAGLQLNVDRVLVGYVTQSENRIRVSLQLIDVGEDAVVWSGDVEGSLSDPSAFAEAIRARVSPAL